MVDDETLLGRIGRRKPVRIGAAVLIVLIALVTIRQLTTGPAPTASGDWVGRYGADGYALGGWSMSGELASLPHAELTLTSGKWWVWAARTTVTRALQSPDRSTREAATWYGARQLVLELKFSAAYTGSLSLYAVDWDYQGRRETLTVGSRTVALSSDFSQGAWRTFPITAQPGGTVTITATARSGKNAVLSGLFLGGGGPRPPSPTPTPRPKKAPTPPATATSTPTPVSAGSNCFASPGSCGFPDPANGTAGVPAGTPLKPSGGLDITTPGAVISGRAITGKVTIDAPNVTIKDSRITWSTPTDAAIQVNGVNAHIENTTITGQDSGQNSLEHAIYSRNHTTVGKRLDMENCAECWTGAGTLTDSYALVHSTRAGEHLEAVYYGGGDVSLTIDHNTLLNPSIQTGVIFVSSDFGNVTNVSIQNNLLAGGGAAIWGGTGCSTGTCGRVLGPVTVTGNRFARCLSTAVFDRASGGTGCQNGTDSHGYWPHGGYLFPVTRVSNAVTTWSENVWDDNGATIPGCTAWYSC